MLQPGSEISLTQDTSLPASLMSEASTTSTQATWRASTNATSSPVLVDGRWHCVGPDGLIHDLFGVVPLRANLSARQARDLGLLTTVISGRRSATSSRSAALQRSLESKLRARLEGTGSPLYELTWKRWDMPQGAPICALRASALITSGSDSSGRLPTPSGTSNHGKNHVAGRLDEWGGSSNPFRGTSLGPIHSPGFELNRMGYPDAWRELMPPATPSSRRSRKHSSKQ